MKCSRREALRKGLRIGGVIGLAGLMGSLVIRARDCRASNPCAVCGEFSRCGLPKARAARDTPKEENCEC